ncbi:hypothetical protein HT031_003812 [Scenedesmus sp. PABB004]|nr:hypothetical protein HT031_003812 [Scenedesmus sp. PABB004]
MAALRILFGIALIGLVAGQATPAHHGHGKSTLVLYDNAYFSAPTSDAGAVPGDTAVYTSDLSLVQGGPIVGKAVWTGVYYAATIPGSDAGVNWALSVRLPSYGKYDSPLLFTAAGSGGGVEDIKRASYALTGVVGAKASGDAVVWENGTYWVPLY